MPRKPVLTSSRKQILALLGEYKQLLTTDLWKEIQPEKVIQYTQQDLSILRRMRLINSYPAYPELGNSEHYWQLTRKGALEIGIEFASHYYRKPTTDQLEFRRQQLALTRAVKEAGWSLVKPLTWSSTRPLPVPTKQSQLIEYALGLQQYQILKGHRESPLPEKIQDLLEYQGKTYRLGLPPNLNDYVVYSGTGSSLQVVILILPPPRATHRFWQTRFETYKSIAPRLSTLAIFTSVQEVQIFLNPLKKAKIQPVLLAEVAQYLLMHQKETSSKSW